MENVLRGSFLLFLLVCNLQCTQKNYPVSYSIYKGDKEIDFPKSKIELSLLNDSSGVFKNSLESDSVFIQKFNYQISDDAFLHINHLDTTYSGVISLSVGDTITMYKKKMLYFYDGEKKYLLYFKKNLF